tara:strand:- start:44 stop:346 length:303 start_codon:yes stop_codon:yes gene_type:complete
MYKAASMLGFSVVRDLSAQINALDTKLTDLMNELRGPSVWANAPTCNCVCSALSLRGCLLYPVSAAVGGSTKGGGLTALVTLPVVGAVWRMVRRLRQHLG